jgi:hypothetical protein
LEGTIVAKGSKKGAMNKGVQLAKENSQKRDNPETPPQFPVTTFVKPLNQRP